MKVVGIIPSRYSSSRLPGKPLVDILGKPMVWWVYQQAINVPEFDEVYVATDDERIRKVCEEFHIKVIMTSDKHNTHIDRIQEVSDSITADYYVVVCGDEPMILPEIISSAIPKEIIANEKYTIRVLMRELNEAVFVIDPANIKITTNAKGECISLSRSPIPFPYKTIDFKYKKIVGVECYNKNALDFFKNTSIGELERIEDITLLRFLENKINMIFTMVNSETISVDTPKDLEYARKMIGERLNSEKC